MKKALFILTALILSCTAFAAPIQLETVENAGETACSEISAPEALLYAEYEGEGTKDSPYIISNVEQLSGIAPIVNSAAGKEYYFSLGADIDLENAEWTPIGTSSNPFNGAFYGNGYSVSNFKITQGRTDNGFFGYVKQADITNLSLHNVTLKYNYTGGTSTYAGILSGRLSKELTGTDVVNTISEISVTGNIEITSKNSASYTGGLIGYTNSKSGNYSIENCLSLTDISITSENSRKVYAGGIAAKLEDNVSKFTLTIKNSYYNGDINILSQGEVTCGGIAGDVFSAGSGWVSGWYGTLMADYTESNLVKNIAGGSIRIDTTGKINVGYTVGYLNSETTLDKAARLSSQTIFAQQNGTEYTKIYDSPKVVNPENFEVYATETLGFDKNIWNFDYASDTPVLGNTVLTEITYDANGGEKAPEQQLKIYNSDIVLSSEVPSRTGHTFRGWSTSADGEVEYAPGAKYSSNENKTLYAVWEKGDVSGDGKIDKADVVIVTNYVVTLISNPAESLTPEQFDFANVYKDDEEADGTGAKINIKDLIKLLQLASKN